jgi:hypothetical protein
MVMACRPAATAAEGHAAGGVRLAEGQDIRDVTSVDPDLHDGRLRTTAGPVDPRRRHRQGEQQLRGGVGDDRHDRRRAVAEQTISSHATMGREDLRRPRPMPPVDDRRS